MTDQKAEAMQTEIADTENEELSADALDEVSGGINPQPLPPMPRMAQ